jgi:hypothetical protein
VVNATPRPLYPRERDQALIVQEAGWGPGPVWTGAENVTLTGIRSPDPPTRSKWLYRLRYPGPQYKYSSPLYSATPATCQTRPPPGGDGFVICELYLPTFRSNLYLHIQIRHRVRQYYTCMGFWGYKYHFRSGAVG